MSLLVTRFTFQHLLIINILSQEELFAWMFIIIIFYYKVKMNVKKILFVPILTNRVSNTTAKESLEVEAVTVIIEKNQL